VAFRLPPGPGWINISNSSGTAFVGPGSNLTASNGYVVPSGGYMTFEVYQGSGGGTIYISGTATVSWLVSAPSAQTGP
jgi:hypothetical protein